MSQRVKEFVRQSGVEVSNSNSNDDNFARELEETMLRKERERAAGFRTPPRPMRPPRVQVPQRLQQKPLLVIAITNHSGTNLTM